MRLSHWQGNCNGQIRHRPCNETNRHEAWSCPDRDPLGTLGTDVLELEASWAPSHRQLFEYSLRGSIAGQPVERQARERYLGKAYSITSLMEPFVHPHDSQDKEGGKISGHRAIASLLIFAMGINRAVRIYGLQSPPIRSITALVFERTGPFGESVVLSRVLSTLVGV